MKTIVYNAQYCPKRHRAARKAHVAAFAHLAALNPDAIGICEAGGYRKELRNVPGYQAIQPGGAAGKCALLIRNDVMVHDHGAFKLHGRKFVGRDVPGARRTGITSARYIVWALIDDLETGGLRYVAVWHPVPGQSHSKRARALLADEARVGAAWLAKLGHPADLMGDTNGAPDLPLFGPLRKVASSAFAVSRKGAAIDGHWITDGTADATALDGYPSDHKPVVADITWKHKEKPVPVTAQAADLSHWNGGALDFAAAHNGGIQAVWHKATEGARYVDPKHDERRTEANTAGVPFGSYHFARPGNPKQQAQHFLGTAAVKRGDLRPMLDLEDGTMGGWSVRKRTRWVKAWVHSVQAACGEPPLIYTPFDLSDNFDCPLWVARYSDAMSAPRVPRPWATWSLWQFTDGKFGAPNSAPGLGHVDLNTFNTGVTLDLLILGQRARKAKHDGPLTRGGNIDKALRALAGAKGKGDRATAIKTAVDALESIPTWHRKK